MPYGNGTCVILCGIGVILFHEQPQEQGYQRGAQKDCFFKISTFVILNKELNKVIIIIIKYIIIIIIRFFSIALAHFSNHCLLFQNSSHTAHNRR